jgi:hypothetical protein
VDHIEEKLFSRQTRENNPSLEMCDLVFIMLNEECLVDKLGRMPLVWRCVILYGSYMLREDCLVDKLSRRTLV